MGWLEVAKKLPINGKHRMVHGCASDKSMIVSHSAKGYTAFCFRCGTVGFEGHGFRTLAELEEIKRVNEAARRCATSTELRLPPKSRDFDRAGILWLAKAGISETRARLLGIYWSEEIKRVVIPVYNKAGKLTFWQARRVFDDKTCKYLSPAINRDEVLYWCIPEEATTERIVVTEDIASAIRVGKHVPAASLLGTKVSSQQIDQLTQYGEVTIWLDPDDAGREGAYKLRKACSLFSQVSNVVSRVDPKNLSDEEIRQHLSLPPLNNPRRITHD